MTLYVMAPEAQKYSGCRYRTSVTYTGALPAGVGSEAGNVTTKYAMPPMVSVAELPGRALGSSTVTHT